MSTQDSDGIDEALQGVTHVAMTAAARMGEQLARMREQQAREAQARSEQAAREQAARMTAERDAARSSLAPVHRPEWWDTAQAEDVTKAYTTAKAWSEVDPEAVRAEQRIVEEVRARFGVDVTRDGEPANVAEAIERAERARADANQERGGARDDRAEAVGLMAAANATDRAAEADVRAAEAAADDPELADLIDPQQRDPEADVDEVLREIRLALLEARSDARRWRRGSTTSRTARPSTRGCARTSRRAAQRPRRRRAHRGRHPRPARTAAGRRRPGRCSAPARAGSSGLDDRPTQARRRDPTPTLRQDYDHEACPAARAVDPSRSGKCPCAVDRGGSHMGRLFAMAPGVAREQR